MAKQGLHMLVRHWAPAHVKSDEVLMQKACLRNPKYLEHVVDASLKTKRDFIANAIHKNPQCLCENSQGIFLPMPDKVANAIQSRGQMGSCSTFVAPKSLLSSRQFMEVALKRFPWLFQYALVDLLEIFGSCIDCIWKRSVLDGRLPSTLLGGEAERTVLPNRPWNWSVDVCAFFQESLSQYEKYFDTLLCGVSSNYAHSTLAVQAQGMKTSEN